ncbi:MAG: hypothetical protein LAT55_11880 [Opitutales bacterium]|nr:hypothetical protein [Opitutales bacterium]
MNFPSTKPARRPSHRTDQRAIQILRENDWGGYTLPSKGLYPYQWNWDSMFVALGFSEFDLDRAWTEVESLFEGQWGNGMAAHIVFRRDMPGYFPGPRVWETTEKIPTSGLSQPPVAATVVRDLFEKDREFGWERLREIFSKLVKWHRWFHTMRVISGGTAIVVTHPWESGRDNSPDWDAALRLVDSEGIEPYTRCDLGHVDAAMRPTKEDYDRYMKLVEYGRSTGWDHTQITREGPFAVADPGITFILTRADRDLKYLAQVLGYRDSLYEIEGWLATSGQAADSLWSEELQAYVAYDLRHGCFAEGVSSVAFLSFYAGLSHPGRDRFLLRHLHRFLDAVQYGVPSFDPEHPFFESKRYWRGPTWAIINYLIARGLLDFGLREEADLLRHSTREMISKHGFYEYFDPLDGTGSGGKDFTWTAAIWLAWASPMVDGSKNHPPAFSGEPSQA